jgi:chromosome segregation ATPase
MVKKLEEPVDIEILAQGQCKAVQAELNKLKEQLQQETERNEELQADRDGRVQEAECMVERIKNLEEERDCDFGTMIDEIKEEVDDIVNDIDAMRAELVDVANTNEEVKRQRDQRKKNEEEVLLEMEDAAHCSGCRKRSGPMEDKWGGLNDKVRLATSRRTKEKALALRRAEAEEKALKKAEAAEEPELKREKAEQKLNEGEMDLEDARMRADKEFERAEAQEQKKELETMQAAEEAVVKQTAEEAEPELRKLPEDTQLGAQACEKVEPVEEPDQETGDGVGAQERLGNMQAELDRLKERNGELQADRDDRVREADEMDERINSLEAERDGDLKDMVEDLRQDVDDRRYNVEQFQAKVDSLVSEADKMRACELSTIDEPHFDAHELKKQTENLMLTIDHEFRRMAKTKNRMEKVKGKNEKKEKKWN